MYTYLFRSNINYHTSAPTFHTIKSFCYDIQFSQVRNAHHSFEIEKVKPLSNACTKFQLYIRLMHSRSSFHVYLHFPSVSQFHVQYFLCLFFKVCKEVTVRFWKLSYRWGLWRTGRVSACWADDRGSNLAQVLCPYPSPCRYIYGWSFEWPRLLKQTWNYQIHSFQISCNNYISR